MFLFQFQMFDKDLGKLLASELHGNMERLVFNCLQAAEEGYDSEFHSPEKARDDAELIQNFGQGRVGTNERGIFKILCGSPPQHLELINHEYGKRENCVVAVYVQQWWRLNECETNF
jgi:hypothetical protein